MTSLNTLYAKLCVELNLALNSRTQITPNLSRFVADVQSLLVELFPIGTKEGANRSVELSILSVVKLFLRLVLLMPDSAVAMEIFNRVFVSSFLDSLIAQDRADNELCLAHMIHELSAHFVFACHKLNVCKYFGGQEVVEYFRSKTVSVKMNLHLVNSLCKLTKQHRNVSFSRVLGSLFSHLIWKQASINTNKEDQMLYVKLCVHALSTSSGEEIRTVILQDFEFFVDFFCPSNDDAIKNFVIMLVNELFPYPGNEVFDRDLLTTKAIYLLAVIQKTKNKLLQGTDVPTACVAMFRISLWALRNSNPTPSEGEILANIFATLEHYSYTEEQLIAMCIEEDKELIDFLLLQLELFWITRRVEVQENGKCQIMKIIPSDLFLELMVKLSFDESVLNDWLISNETCFLRYFIKVCKILRIFWTDFTCKCKMMNSAQRIQNVMNSNRSAALLDACMSALIRLKLKIVRLHLAGLYPYSPQPLIKLLTELETMYECGESDT